MLAPMPCKNGLSLEANSIDLEKSPILSVVLCVNLS